MAPRTWFPEVLTGSQVVLRRHVPENLPSFHRWYSDPEIARLARYQEAPMRADEIERFFAARVVGSDALAMAIHERAGDRLVGTCAFSQLDGDNGSALYHITIGEKDAWGRGYGTEATRLMLDHAFGVLGLHRVALFVFEFNERAIRAYRRCGFVAEGRSRESIFREGQWWDELAMSVLESDWRKLRAAGPDEASERDGLEVGARAVGARAVGARAVGAPAVGAGTAGRTNAAVTPEVVADGSGTVTQAATRAASGLVRRTIRRFS